LGEQGLEGQKIITFDYEIAGRFTGRRVLRLIVQLFHRFQCMIGNGQMMIPDGIFSLEL
jgi:hypothetical protein